MEIPKVKILIGTIGILLAFLVFAGMDKFYDKYDIRWQTPIIIQTPVWIEPRTQHVIKPQPLPTPEKEEHTMKVVKEVQAAEPAIPSYEQIFEAARELESNKGEAKSGHHIYCADKGMWNEVGYGVWDKFCFDDMEHGKRVTMNWYKDKIEEKGMTLYEALCYWEGQGKEVSDCKYANDFKKIISSLNK